jgi:hypothetical protein
MEGFSLYDENKSYFKLEISIKVRTNYYFVSDLASFFTTILRFYLGAGSAGDARGTISGRGGANVFIQSNTLCRSLFSSHFKI